MHQLLQRTGSRLLFVTCADVRHKELSRSEFYGAEDSAFLSAAEEYREEMFQYDPSLSYASEHPNAGVCDTSTLMADDDFRRLPYVRWQENLLKTVHWRVFYTRPVDDLSFAVSLHPPASDGPASKEQGKLHKLLFEHIERALRLGARPPDLAESGEAVIILDTAGQVLTMSPRAERVACQGDGLIMKRRQLHAASSDADERLRLAIISAVNSRTLGGAGGGVRLPRPAGGHWLALVSPCPRFLEHLPVRTPAAVVRIVEVAGKSVIGPGHAELFDLTPREIEVAEALLRGHSIESMCHALNISRNTAKAHVQSLFRKTRTSRQSELVHLLSEIVRN